MHALLYTTGYQYGVELLASERPIVFTDKQGRGWRIKFDYRNHDDGCMDEAHEAAMRMLTGGSPHERVHFYWGGLGSPWGIQDSQMVGCSRQMCMHACTRCGMRRGAPLSAFAMTCAMALPKQP